MITTEAEMPQRLTDSKGPLQGYTYKKVSFLLRDGPPNLSALLEPTGKSRLASPSYSSTLPNSLRASLTGKARELGICPESQRLTDKESK